jgi:hypothetical protein
MTLVLQHTTISGWRPDTYSYFSDGPLGINQVRARINPDGNDCSSSIGPVVYADPVIDGGLAGSLDLRPNWWLTDSSGATGKWRVARYSVALNASAQDEYGDYNTLLPFTLSDWCGSSFSASASVSCGVTIEDWTASGDDPYYYYYAPQYSFLITGGTVTYSW